MLLDEATIAEKETGSATLVNNLHWQFLRIQSIRHHHLDQTEVVSTVRTTGAAWIRSVGQIGALALGACLVTIDALSAGGMIAGSIIVSKSISVV